ncbi:MAG: rod shape-determining protein MreC [Solirubrobacteraceae bacterium]
MLAGLVAISLILLTAYFGESPSSPLHGVQRGIVAVVSPLQAGASKVLSPVRDVANWVSDTLSAKSKVDRLQQQVARLTFQNDTLRSMQQQNAQLTQELGLSQRIGLSVYHPVGANVIGRDPSYWYQTVEVDAGSDEGVALHDAVVSGGGLVGLVTTVDPSSSIITLITDPAVQVGAQILDAKQDDGILAPSVGNPNQLQMQDLPNSASISAGWQVVTSGFKSGGLTSYYPPGLPIGTVASSLTQTQISNDLLNNGEVPVTPSADLRHFDSVLILTSTHAGGARAQVPSP